MSTIMMKEWKLESYREVNEFKAFLRKAKIRLDKEEKDWLVQTIGMTEAYISLVSKHNAGVATQARKKAEMYLNILSEIKELTEAGFENVVWEFI